MQLASITQRPTSPATTPVVDAPAFTGGIDFSGSGRFTKFGAHATNFVYGDRSGYGSLQEAIDATTLLTVGARESAAGIFELDGRFHARRMDNELTFATGATWKGVWRLEQFPADRELLDGSLQGVTRSADLRAIVDGAERHLVDALPVA